MNMVHYRMLGKDVDVNPGQYRIWVSPTPDYSGQNYTGLKAGPNPLANVLAYDISDSVISNFKLPNPLEWVATDHTLPYTLESSSLAIIDGYAYLFGGVSSAKILRAGLARPTEWEDTGATLPAALSNSHLAVVNNTIYLFGGVVNSMVTNHIYSAPTSNPLIWSDTGGTLPDNIADGQLIISANQNLLVIVGGRNNFAAKANTYTASINNPLSWTDVNENLPFAVYKFQSALIGNFLYVFGGLSGPNSPSSYILSIQIGMVGGWQATGSLPFPSAGGQFVSVGDKGYLITPGSIPLSQRSFGTRIYQCNLSTPNVWFDTGVYVPGEVSNSQLGIIDDRLYLFGGSGSNVIFNDYPFLTYNLNSSTVVAYGNITRTGVQTAPNPIDLFGILGFPPWKTNY